MEKLTASLRKTVASLGTSASERRSTGLFKAEGTRCVTDMLPHMQCRYLFATSKWIEENPCLINNPALIQVSASDVQRMSSMQTPQPVIAVFEIPRATRPCLDGSAMTLALDSVQNPGNLGTIIRLADWFGITQIVATRETADAFNPKVVQATMGALVRVSVHYSDDLATLLQESKLPVIGTFLNGRNLYEANDIKLSPKPIIVMGNEGAGISPKVEKVVTDRIHIPSFPPGRTTSESLNVAMATGIVISELSRRIYG